MKWQFSDVANMLYKPVIHKKHSHDSSSFCTEQNFQIVMQVGRTQLDCCRPAHVRRKKQRASLPRWWEFMGMDSKGKRAAQRICSRNLYRWPWIQSYGYKGSDSMRPIREQTLGSCEMTRGSEVTQCLETGMLIGWSGEPSLNILGFQLRHQKATIEKWE